jgi:DNA helicase-2/ATP-dependent DNA helicase PcrA
MPHKRALDDAGNDERAASAALEEERRLFYVAITRARDLLLLTNTEHRKKGQNYEESIPSPFLDEIPANLLARHHGSDAADTEEDDEQAAEAAMALLKARLGQH